MRGLTEGGGGGSCGVAVGSGTGEVYLYCVRLGACASSFFVCVLCIMCVCAHGWGCVYMCVCTWMGVCLHVCVCV